MAPNGLRDRIADQFSYRGERADVWRAFDLFLDTDAYLNLGYSGRYRPYVLGSPQRRLAGVVGERLAAHLPATEDVRLLDVGCGRGGPTIHLAERFGFRAVGVDLVPYNVGRAREHVERGTNTGPERNVWNGNADGEENAPPDVEYVVGDATRLPLAPDSIGACTAIDSLVYLPDRRAAFDELATVLEPGGVFACSDLLAGADLADDERRAVDSFAEAWDMPSPATFGGYERALDDAGFDVRERTDVTPNSVGRFRTWTTAFLRILASPLGPPVERALRARDLDPSVIERQVSRAHEALPHLRHVVLVANA
jgi:SAM-dependent methyltransferase